MMDSRLLNVFHDDPFDGNYIKYENDSDFWSNNNETLDLQLTETLHGILPITGTDGEEVTTVVSKNHSDSFTATLLKDDFPIENKIENSTSKMQSKNMLYLNDFTEHHLATGRTIEIITVDPSVDDYDSDLDDDDDDNENIEHHFINASDDLDDYDKRSQCSISTFRTRTDSSSIGDYESHTSDYDDDEDDDNYEQEEEIKASQLSAGLLTADTLILNNEIENLNKRQLHTSVSDGDALDIQIDANCFDLADFITKDDFMLNIDATNTIILSPSATTTTIATNEKSKPPIISNVQVISSKNIDSDTDSDAIVDVETVEVEDKTLLVTQVTEIPDDDAPFVDNVKTDPIWSPKQHTAKKIEKVTIKNKPITNFTIIPSKKQCDFLKGKFSNARGNKNTSFQRNNKFAAKKQQSNVVADVKQQTVPLPKVGIGQGGKNLALIEHNRQRSSSEKSSEDNNTPIKIEPEQKEEQQQQQQQEQQSLDINMQTTTAIEHKPAVKRKLNLEEYKKRRGENLIPATDNITNANKFMSTGTLHNTIKVKILDQANIQAVPHNINTNAKTIQVKHSDEVTAVVRTLKEEVNRQKPMTDPITEAKNKVLRMQELKRAQKLKMLDSAVSAKVPRVTKMVPLKEIVKDTYCIEAETQANDAAIAESSKLKTHPDYEEIIIVSTSCNTDISIPPISILPNQNVMDIKNINNASRSLLKSSVLLYNINDTFQKAQSADNVKISTNSLIASIQDVVVKQSNKNDSTNVTNTTSTCKSSSTNTEQHGENKIIMHLRKDRIRKQAVTISTQTDFQPAFPTLPLVKTANRKSRERVRKNRNYRKRKTNANSATNATSDSSDAEPDCANSLAAFPYRSRSHSATNESCSSSLERLRQTSDVTTANTGSYSSRSSRRHRSSISSSYSESERRLAAPSSSSNAQNRDRQRRTSYKQRSKRRGYSSRSTSSSSLSDYSYRSRSRSRSPYYRNTRSPSISRSRSRMRGANNKRVSQPAVEERRIVYVGRIEQETTKEMLRRKFLAYGTIKQITIHYKENGMKYGFVTYERSQDAFTVIDTSAQDSQINMYDISFGGRRAFCRASYADLDNAGINTYQSFVFPKVAAPVKEEDSFEALLLKVKAKLNANKPATTTQAQSQSTATTATTTVATTSNSSNTNKI